jgi:hypothetical protein
VKRQLPDHHPEILSNVWDINGYLLVEQNFWQFQSEVHGTLASQYVWSIHTNIGNFGDFVFYIFSSLNQLNGKYRGHPSTDGTQSFIAAGSGLENVGWV